MPSLLVFGSTRLFDEVRAEFDFFVIRGRKNYFFGLARV